MFFKGENSICRREYVEHDCVCMYVDEFIFFLYNYWISYFYEEWVSIFSLAIVNNCSVNAAQFFSAFMLDFFCVIDSVKLKRMFSFLRNFLCWRNSFFFLGFFGNLMSRNVMAAKFLEIFEEKIIEFHWKIGSISYFKIQLKIWVDQKFSKLLRIFCKIRFFQIFEI